MYEKYDKKGKRYPIEIYLRRLVSKKIIKFINKEYCDVCGAIHNLEVHHETMKFARMFHQSLYNLGFEYKKYPDEYKAHELESIEIYLLGWHITSKFAILCQSCHKETEYYGTTKFLFAEERAK